MSLRIRALGGDDSELYSRFRLRALAEHPEAFLSSVEEERRNVGEATRQRLADKEGRDDDMILGAFADADIVGMIGAIRDRFIKARHKAIIWGMYVAANHRRAGVGGALLDRAIELICRADGIEQINLSVMIGNRGARALYLSRGFEIYAVEPRAMKIDDTYYDDEHMVLYL